MPETAAPTSAGRATPAPRAIHTVAGGGGVALHVREWGPAEAPALVLLHGWSQHHLCWRRQIDSALTRSFRLIAFDLRGHGMSGKPDALEAYADGALWAADVAATLEALRPRAPVLVGWSYAGLAIGDYLRRFGEGGLAGVCLVGAMARIDRTLYGDLMGAEVPTLAAGMAEDDQPAILAGAMGFARACLHAPPDAETLAFFTGLNLFATSRARRGMFRRTDDFRGDYASLGPRLLAIHGAEDRIVLPAMTAALAAAAPAMERRAYEAVGHCPFWEAPERFNADLAAFARRVQSA